MNEKDLLLLEKLNQNISYKDTEIGEAIEIIIRLFESLKTDSINELGAFSIPFNAADFTGNASLVWTVNAGQLVHYTGYFITSDLLLLQWAISNSTLSGITSNVVFIRIPKNYALAKNKSGGLYTVITGYGFYFNNGVWDTHLIQGVSNSNLINLQKRDNTNYTLAGGLQTYGSVILRVTK